MSCGVIWCCCSARILVNAAAASSNALLTEDVKRRKTSGSAKALPSCVERFPIPRISPTIQVQLLQPSSPAASRSASNRACVSGSTLDRPASLKWLGRMSLDSSISGSASSISSYKPKYYTLSKTIERKRKIRNLHPELRTSFIMELRNEARALSFYYKIGGQTQNNQNTSDASSSLVGKPKLLILVSSACITCPDPVFPAISLMLRVFSSTTFSCFSLFIFLRCIAEFTFMAVICFHALKHSLFLNVYPNQRYLTAHLVAIFRIHHACATSI